MIIKKLVKNRTFEVSTTQNSLEFI